MLSLDLQSLVDFLSVGIVIVYFLGALLSYLAMLKLSIWIISVQLAYGNIDRAGCVSPLITAIFLSFLASLIWIRKAKEYLIILRASKDDMYKWYH